MATAARLPAPRRRRRTDRWRAKYELLHVVRTHMGQDDAHYGCVYQKEDSQGKPGGGSRPCTAAGRDALAAVWRVHARCTQDHLVWPPLCRTRWSRRVPRCLVPAPPIQQLLPRTPQPPPATRPPTHQPHAHTAGVFLSKDLMRIAGHALKANITTLGPLVLPISEQLLFFANLVARKVRGAAGRW